MTLKLVDEPAPLEVGADGAIYIRGTDVPLSAVIEAYESGKSAKAIQRKYATAGVADVYAALAYYLRRREAKTTVTPPIERDSLPIRLVDEGVVRVGTSRVSLDTVLCRFGAGATPERIVHEYDTLELADVYGTLAYYLRHQQQVEEYMDEGERRLEELRRQHPDIFISHDEMMRRIERREEEAQTRAAVAGYCSQRLGNSTGYRRDPTHRRIRLTERIGRADSLSLVPFSRVNRMRHSVHFVYTPLTRR